MAVPTQRALAKRPAPTRGETDLIPAVLVKRRAPIAVADLTKCHKCPLESRTKVRGYGCIDRPDIAFVAEAPGATEVEIKRPLVGKAGLFLRKLLKDLGIDAKRCYFTNTCLCRPDGNAKPKAESIEACKPRLMAELAAIRPRLIVTLGTTPTKGFAAYTRGITFSHGVHKTIRFKGMEVGVFPTFHPSGVLRAPEHFLDIVDDLNMAKRIVDGEEPIIEPPYENYHVVETQEQFDHFLFLLGRQKLAACDIETTTSVWTTGEILCAGFSWAREEAYIVDWRALIADNLDNLRALDDVLAGVKLSFQNGPYDAPFLLHAGFKNIDYYFDTMLAHYLIDERQGTHGLERLAIKYYKAPDYKQMFREAMGIKGKVSDKAFAKAIAQVDKYDLFMYNGADVDYTYRLTRDLAEEVKAEDQLGVLGRIEMPAARMFMEFHMHGMLIDGDYWRSMSADWQQEMVDLEEELRSYPGARDLNFGSPKQLAVYLFDKLKLLPFGGKASFKGKKIDEGVISKAIAEVDDPEAREYWTSKRTQMSEGLKGFGGVAKGLSPRSTTAYMLYFLRQQHDFPGTLLKWKHLQKRDSMYGSGMAKYVWKDGRVHPSYNMTATRTGRKATNDPAIHNLPRGDEIYNLFIADPGWVIIHGDYSQAEMRFMAHLSKNKALTHLLNTTDIHTRIAMEMFGLSEEDVANMPKDELKDKRIASKMITFGIPYGRSPAGLAPQLGVSKEEAVHYQDAYYALLPGFREWVENHRRMGADNHMAVSIFNRRRRFPLILDKYHRREVERQAGNMPIQSAINDLTLLAHINTLIALRDAGIPVFPWPHIHDSLNVMVPKPLWKLAVKIMADVMTDIPFESDLEFPVEIECGERWGAMPTVYDNDGWVESEEVAALLPG